MAGLSLPLTAQEYQPATLEDLTRDNIQRIAKWLESLSPEELAQHSAAVAERQRLANLRLKQTSEFTCLPSCAVDDAKFLAIAGEGLVTLSDLILDLSISAPAGTSSFTVGVFDGDGGEPDGTTLDGLSRWDIGDPAPFLYSVIASPPGAPETQIDLATGAPGACAPTADLNGRITMPDAACSVAGSAMPNGAWFDFPAIATGPEALAPSGVLNYRLEVRQTSASTLTINAFKVRTSEIVTIRLGEQPFSYIAAVNSADDFITLYPNFTPTPTTYDGEFRYFFDVGATQPHLFVWGGDSDRGDFDAVTNQDSDDPDTPNAPFLPLFDVTADAVPEGVAIGAAGTTGDPPDNVEAPGPFSFFVRDPSIRADLIFADGRSFSNENPSGNQEWEQFLVSTDASCDPTPVCVPNGLNPPTTSKDPAGFPCADVCLPSAPNQIPSGIYELRVQGVDLINLNALRLPQLLCVNELGAPCRSLLLFELGDTVFLDLDGNGVQDGGEPGIPGVIVNLLDEDGNFAGSTVTDENGNYRFGADEGTFSVQVADENFTAPAAGIAVGDRVWLDDGDGIDSAEPGLANVRVNVFEIGADMMAGTFDDVFFGTTLTDRNGFYLFDGLPAGTYYTDVVDATVPDGLALVTAAGASDPSATTPPDGNLALDFPYTEAGIGATATVGDFVWSDADGDGVQDPGEPGIGGVTVDLLLGGLPVATTTTASDGSYLFTGVLPGLYQVDVTDTAGELAGYTLTSGPGSNPDPTVAFTVLAGDVIPTKDFGYNNPSLFDLADRVWRDLDSDGLFDGADVAIAGVTVNLVGLVGPGNMIIATTTTDANGDFAFTGLPDGDYQIVIGDVDGVLSGLLPTTPGAASGTHFVEIDGADVTGESFGYNDVPVLQGLVGTTVKAPNADVDEQVDTLVDQNVLDYDFGYIAAGSLGDRVWFDADGDGVQDAGEPGIPGVTVTLLDPDTGAMQTTVTGPDGVYVFTGLRPNDDYVVTVDDSTLPAGLDTPTYDLDDPAQPIATPHTAVASLGISAPGVTEDRSDVDFGYQGTGSIGDRVWLDTSGDGVQDGGEDGINGVTVELLDGGGNVIATQVTSGDGNYLFEGLPPGDYTVRVVPPAGGIQTFDLDGTLDNETTVTLGLDENRTDVDFGYLPGLGSIGDRVWLDANGDGIQDGGEAGINGVTVTLLDGGGVPIASTVTSGDGNYLFDGLEAGVYTVVVDASTLPADLAQTFDLDGLDTPNGAMVTLAAGENKDDVDFGYGECGPCAGKVTRLTLQYLGATMDAHVEVFAKKGPNTESVFDGTLQPGDVFDVIGLPTGNPGFTGTLGTEIRIFVDGSLHTMLHTSCSVPIGPGTVSGDFMVLAGASKNGGLLCPIGGGGEDCSPVKVRDDFEVQSYDNNDGPDDWAGGWIENDPKAGGAGPAGGSVKIYSGSLKLYDRPNSGAHPSAARQVDLEGASDATLRFKFKTSGGVDSSDAVTVEVSSDAGASWTTLEKITGITGQTVEERDFDISDFISSETQVRFRVSKNYGGSGEYFYVKWVEIETGCDGGECQGFEVLDTFETVSYTNDDGPDSWADGWIENDPKNGGEGPWSGQVQVHDGFLTMDDYPNTGGYPSIARQVDLSAVPNPTLEFDFYTSGGVDPDDAVKVEVSSDGGATWTTLEVIDGIDGAVVGERSFDLSDFASSETQVRFKVKKNYGGQNELFCLGFVRIVAGCPSGECQAVTVRDDFESVSFTNQDGPDSWADGWIEDDPKNGGEGPWSGQVQIHDGFLTMDDYPNTGGQPSIARQVDLAGATSATLRFDFFTSGGVDRDDAVTVEISNDGGATWTTLEVIDNIRGAKSGERSIDITEHASAETQVRFRVSKNYGGSNEIFCLGFVEIEAGC